MDIPPKPKMSVKIKAGNQKTSGDRDRIVSALQDTCTFLDKGWLCYNPERLKQHILCLTCKHGPRRVTRKEREKHTACTGDSADILAVFHILLLCDFNDKIPILKLKTDPPQSISTNSSHMKYVLSCLQTQVEETNLASGKIVHKPSLHH